jgi:retron-type reverse transcriptase
MKRTGHIYENITDVENIKAAIRNASKGKRNHRAVKRVLGDIDQHAEAVSRMLKDKTYRPAPYVRANIMDGSARKRRTICKPKFYPDQVIHWALMLQLQPILQRGMYYYSCGSIPGKGTSFGQKAVRKWMGDGKNTKYCLKMDVKQFYPSISNENLKKSFRRLVKDPDALWLTDTIIDTAPGLPIGNYTSQWFANHYLTPLDHAIKGWGVKYYMRYVDDLVLFGPNKRKLRKAKERIEQSLAPMGLEIKGNWQLFRVDSRPVDFLGLRFYRDRTTLRRRNSLRIRRRAKKIGRKGRLGINDARAMISYWGWIKRSDSYKYYVTHIRPNVKIGRCRKVVSDHAKANRTRPGAGV